MNSLPIELQEACVATDKIGTIKRILHKYKADGSICSKGKDNCMTVQRTYTGWMYRCFRCNMRGKIRCDGLTPQETLRLLGDPFRKPKNEEVSVLPPYDAEPIIISDPTCIINKNIPLRVIRWLYQYRIMSTEMKKYDIRYSNDYRRIIFPIKNTYFLNPSLSWDVPLGWIGRGEPFDIAGKGTKAPKWLIKKYPTLDSFHFHIMRDDSITDKNIFVLTEDIISAIRVHEATGYYTVALLGTWLSDKLREKLRSYDIRIWLDSDALEKSIKYWKNCISVGLSAKYVYTPLDPKCYSNEAIVANVE